MNNKSKIIFKNELYHHGVKGQHWGIRKYQNENGTLNVRGRMKYRHGLNADKSIKSNRTYKLEKQNKKDKSFETEYALAKSKQQDAWKQTRNSYAKNTSNGKKRLNYC